MKNRFYLLNVHSFVRALFIMMVTLAAVFLGGAFLSQVINAVYIMVDYSDFWFRVFYFLSRHQFFFGFSALVVSLALCSGWILAPTFDNFTGLVSRSLQFVGDKPEKVTLPKGMKHLEDELNNVNKELRLWKYAMLEAEQRKDDLVVYLAHDIRTPLTSVLGYLELLAEHPDLPEEQRAKFTGIALRKAGRMQSLVEELFEITRFNVGSMELEKREVNGAMLIHQLVEELQPLLQERQVEVSLQCEEGAVLFVDPDKIARAVDNVLSNAARYTPKGEAVTVSLCKAGRDTTQIQISNTGLEISQEKLDRFFEKFYRGDESRQSGTGGSGLGLAIAKSIVEAHGGNISAENRDRVTTFTIRLPERQAE